MSTETPARKTAKTPARKTAARKTTKAPAKRAPSKTRKTAQPEPTPEPQAEQPAEQPEPHLDPSLVESLREHISDEQIENITDLFLGVHAHATQFGIMQGRRQAAEDLRWLSKARADYDQGNAPDAMDRPTIAACIRAEAAAAETLAGVIEFSRPAAAWLPSWRNSEWLTRVEGHGFNVQQ